MTDNTDFGAVVDHFRMRGVSVIARSYSRGLRSPCS
jgi:hypothetical protein